MISLLLNFMEGRKYVNYSYSYFYDGCRFLYLGAAIKNRTPGSDYYANMLSHSRGRYAVFCYRRMWLNYIKKINLIKRLYASRSDFFFATNRYEHLRLLKTYARASRASVLYYGRTGQFTDWFTRLDMPYLLDKNSAQLGAPSSVPGEAYVNSGGRVLFTLSSDARDEAFLKDLIGADDLLCIAAADVDSLYAGSHFVPLFGNNDSFAAWHFFLEIFSRSAGSLSFPRSGRVGRVVPGVSKFYSRPEEDARGSRRYASRFPRSRARHLPRSIRAHLRARSLRATTVAYDAMGGVFAVQKLFNYMR